MKYRKAYFPCDLEVREEPESGGKYIEGYFAVFDKVTELWPGCYEKIAPGAFTDSLVKNDIRCLFNHNTDLVLGRESAKTLELKEDSTGLWGRVKINDEDPQAVGVYARVKRKDITGCSFGFYEEDNGDGPEFRDGNTYWTIHRADTHEVSICTFPAYPQTEIEARKQEFGECKKRELETRREKLRERIGGLHVKTD